MDINLLLLIVLVALAVWGLVVVWQYAKLQTSKSLSEQDAILFGKGIAPEYQRFKLATIPRATSAQSFIIILTIAVLTGLLAKTLGLV